MLAEETKLPLKLLVGYLDHLGLQGRVNKFFDLVMIKCFSLRQLTKIGTTAFFVYIKLPQYVDRVFAALSNISALFSIFSSSEIFCLRSEVFSPGIIAGMVTLI